MFTHFFSSVSTGLFLLLASLGFHSPTALPADHPPAAITSDTITAPAAQKQTIQTQSKPVPSKEYINTQYGFEFSYPATLSAFEIAGKREGATRLQSNGVAASYDSPVAYRLILSSAVDYSDPKDYGADDPSAITLTQENGSYYYEKPVTVENYWNALTKSDADGTLVNRLVQYENVNGIDLVIFERHDEIPTGGEYVWTSRAVFVADGKFFSIEGASAATVHALVNSIKKIPASKPLPTYIKGESVLY